MRSFDGRAGLARAGFPPDWRRCNILTGANEYPSSADSNQKHTAPSPQPPTSPNAMSNTNSLVVWASQCLLGGRGAVAMHKTAHEMEILMSDDFALTGEVGV